MQLLLLGAQPVLLVRFRLAHSLRPCPPQWTMPLLLRLHPCQTKHTYSMNPPRAIPLAALMHTSPRPLNAHLSLTKGGPTPQVRGLATPRRMGWHSIFIIK